MSELILVGDRVLIDPATDERTTDAGLYLPASVAEKQRVKSGRVVRTGPGYVMPNPEFSEGEPWAAPKNAVRYLPLQARQGDLAFFLRKEGIDIEYEGKPYIIIPHHAILALVRHHPEDVLGTIDELLD